MSAVADFIFEQACRFEHFDAVREMVTEAPGTFLALRVKNSETVDVLPVHVAAALGCDEQPLLVFSFDGDEVTVELGSDGLPCALPAHAELTGFGYDEDDEEVERYFGVASRDGGVVFRLDGHVFFTATGLYESALADGVHLGYTGADATALAADDYFLAADSGTMTGAASWLHRSLPTHGDLTLPVSVWSTSTGALRASITYPFDALALAARRLSNNEEL